MESIDIESFRKLKSSYNTKKEEPLKIQSRQVTVTPAETPLTPEVSPRRNLEEKDLILKAWTEATSSQEDESTLNTRKAPISFRLSDQFMKQLDKIPGRGVGSKIKNILIYNSKSKKVFKDQVSPLISLLGQIDREITQYTATISSISELRGPDGTKIFKLSKEVSLVFQLISFSRDLHGPFLSPAQSKTLDFALGLSRGQNA